MLKWPQNPEYYHINKKYNFSHNALHKNFVRISEYKKYTCKELGVCDSMTKFPALIQLYNATIVDLLNISYWKCHKKKRQIFFTKVGKKNFVVQYPL
jgi:hypothetical protein